MNGFYLIRAAYVFICWGILIVPVLTASSAIQFHASLMLFYLPLGLDYWKHQPKDSHDQWRKNVGIILPSALFCVFLIITIISNEVSLSWMLSGYWKYPIWLLSGFFVFLALRDLISFSSEAELASREITKDNQRERAFNWRKENDERLAHYRHTKTKHHIAKQSRKSPKKKRRR